MHSNIVASGGKVKLLLRFKVVALIALVLLLLIIGLGLTSVTTADYLTTPSKQKELQQKRQFHIHIPPGAIKFHTKKIQDIAIESSTTSIKFSKPLPFSSQLQQSRPTDIHIFTPTEIPKTMMSAPSGTLGVIPKLLYGTAWKKERTKDLVKTAIARGFRAIDTACQPKHYSEALVGQAVADSIAVGIVTRADLFLQTKYTPVRGQDPQNIPYDPSLPLEDQVRASFAKSLVNLQTDYLDSLVLHSPLPTVDETMQVWRIFEELQQSGRVRHIGISNLYDLVDLQAIYDRALVKPTFIQNRFYEKTGWDRNLRAFCAEKNIHYQSFWTLTANPNALSSRLVQDLAAKYGKTNQQIFFNFMTKQQIIFLTGTTSELHMLDDLSVFSFDLTKAEVDAIDALLHK